MLNRDFTNSTLNVIRSTMPKIEAPIQPDWAGIIRQAGKDYNEGALTRKMIDEHPEDEALIRQKGGSAYADMLKADAQRAEDRQWALDDRQAQRDFQREMLDAQTQRAFALENMRNQNARSLAEFKAGLSGDTTAQKNIGYLQTLGYSPEEAAALYYSGNNPTLDMSKLGKKGFEAYDKAQGVALAKQEEQQRLAEQNDARLKAVRESMKNNPDTVGFYSPLKTAVARVLGGAGDKDYLANRGYNLRALGEVQNALIAEAKAAGQSGINTASEIQQATKGLNENSSYEEIDGALQAMQDSIQRLRNSQKPSLMQFNQQPKVDTSDPRVQEALENGYSIEEIQNYLRK